MAKKNKENKIENNEVAGLSPAFAALINKENKAIKPLIYGEGETELVVNINPNPSAIKRGESMATAANAVFETGNHSIEGFIPSFRNFAHKLGVLICFTDLELLQLEINALWQIVNDTTLFDDVAKQLGECEVCEFICDLDELIEVRVSERIHAINFNRVLDKVLDKVEALSGGLGESLKNIDLKGLDVEKIIESAKGIQGAEGLNLEGIIEMFKKNK